MRWRSSWYRDRMIARAPPGQSVIQQRMEFQDAMFDRFTRVVEDEAGRKVAAFMSGRHQHPDLIGEIFVLEEMDLLADEDHGTADVHE
jgi:hypothetical protein